MEQAGRRGYAARFFLIVGALPRPVRRIEMQADQEGHARPRKGFHRAHRTVGQQVGEVAFVVGILLPIPERVLCD